ncbi:hypothetical protein [Methylobacterium sp. J-026]|uniref:hypothetical protein n=1 Tax=Methylobacterium sp. J-026 TaxID=2836624 RepID=UPI001FBAFF69|nr:hypothetical protein [Methylobacterium sp. J-026]
MIDRSHDNAAGGAVFARDADIDQRLGRHAIALLQAARDAGDPTLIAHAEAAAMAVGFALAARQPDGGPGDD